MAVLPSINFFTPFSISVHLHIDCEIRAPHLAQLTADTILQLRDNGDLSDLLCKDLFGAQRRADSALLTARFADVNLDLLLHSVPSRFVKKE